MTPDGSRLAAAAAPEPVVRDHGGGLDAAVAEFGGARGDWLDLSTGINPVAYPVPKLGADVWGALPDRGAAAALEAAARAFWRVPASAEVLAAPGASALIARLPWLQAAARVEIAGPTYNEHAAAFREAGWQVDEGLGGGAAVAARVVVHPNNPDGRFWAGAPGGFLVIDESFCDVCPERSLIGLADQPGIVVLKSFGKFWGLAGLRLGFAIGDPALLARLAGMLGPWPVSGPALAIGAAALRDVGWAERTRARLAADAVRLDAVVGARLVGGTDLFRLYEVADAGHWHRALAASRIWTRVFAYDRRWLRLGLPGQTSGWDRLGVALNGLR